MDLQQKVDQLARQLADEEDALRQAQAVNPPVQRDVAYHTTKVLNIRTALESARRAQEGARGAPFPPLATRRPPHPVVQQGGTPQPSSHGGTPLPNNSYEGAEASVPAELSRRPPLPNRVPAPHHANPPPPPQQLHHRQPDAGAWAMPPPAPLGTPPPAATAHHRQPDGGWLPAPLGTPPPAATAAVGGSSPKVRAPSATSVGSPKKPPLPSSALASVPQPGFVLSLSDTDGMLRIQEFICGSAQIFQMMTKSNRHPSEARGICEAIDSFLREFECHVDYMFDLTSTPVGCCSTFLTYAVDHAHKDVIAHLLSAPHHACPGRQHPAMGHETALHHACFSGSVEIVRMLLDAAEYDFTPLRDAKGHRCFECYDARVPKSIQREIELLCCGVVDGAAPAIDPDDQAAALTATQHSGKLLELQALLSKWPGLSTYIIELDTNETTNLLYSSARNNNAGAIGVLLQNGADPDQQVLNGSTPLHVACYRGYIDCVRTIMHHKPRPRVDIINAYNEVCDQVFREDIPLDIQQTIRRLVREDKTVMLVALRDDDAEAFTAAFGNDNPNTQVVDMQSGMTLDPLQEAARCGSRRVMEILLNRGADGKDAALEIACSKGHIECISSLIKYGADRNVPQRVARQNPHLTAILAPFFPPMTLDQRVEKAIREVGSVADVADLGQLFCSWQQAHAGQVDAPLVTLHGTVSLLWYACWHGNEAAARLLLGDFEASAKKPNLSTMDTPLHVACRRGRTACVAALLSEGGGGGCCDLNARNGGGHLAGDVFEASVAKADKNEISRLLADARQQLESEDELRHVADFVASIPHRKLPGASQDVLSMLHDRAALAAIRTLPDLRTFLSDVLRKALNEKAFQGHNNTTAKHAVLLEFAACVKKAFSQKAHEMIVVGAFTPADAPPPPALFSAVAIDIGLLVREGVASAEVEYFGKGFRKIFSTPDYQARVDNVVKASAATKTDPFARCDIIFAELLAIVRHAIQLYRKTLSGPVISTFLDVWSSNYAEPCLLSCTNWLSLQGLLACADNPDDLFLTSEVVTTADEFLMRHLHALWSTMPDYDELATVVEQIVRRQHAVAAPPPSAPPPSAATSMAPCHPTSMAPPTSMAHPTSCRQQIEMVDVACIKHIEVRLERVISDWLKPQISATPSGAFSTTKRYTDTCIANTVAAAKSVFLAGPLLKGPQKNLLFAPNANFFSESYFSRTYFMNTDVLTDVLKEVRNEHAAHLNKQGCPFTARYTRAVDNVIDQQAGVQHRSVVAQIEGPIRSVHLNTVWSNMAAYERLDEVRSAMQRSQVVLIEADTGSGKSVLLPQFIREELGYRTVVTQPRREASLSTGSHVAVQFSKSFVGYQVAGVDNPCPKGPLQYNTDMFYLGKALSLGDQSDLDKLCVVIDEVHERNAPMDMLFLTLLEKLKTFQQSTCRIVLASATVEKKWFEDTATKFGMKFEHVRLPVKVPFTVDVQLVPHPGITPTAADPTNKAKREVIGANHALQIVKGDKNAKVIVFLPHRRELDSAQREFDQMCGGQVESHAIHAQALNVHAKLQTGRVFFANNVLETTFTVKGLTHVIDFNHSVFQDVNPETNTRELKIGFSTQSSQRQRQGRLGRLQNGTYFHYYDPSALPMSIPVSFAQLPNDTMLQYEIRARHYLRRSLFQNQPGYPTLGDGLVPRPPWVMEMIPTAKDELELAATLSLTGGFACAFLHALKKKTCPRAILWLETIMECRAPFTVGGVPLPSRYANVGLGKHGDFGILLEIFDSYLAAKKKYGPGFNLKQFCAKDQLTVYFLENVASRLEDVDKLLTRLNVDSSGWSSKPQWTWEQIEEALLAGYKHQVVKLVEHSLKSGGYLSKDFQGPYRTLDTNQMHALSLFGNSAWVTNGPSPMPAFLLCHSLETISGRSFVKMVCGVSAAAVEKFLPKDKVRQSLGFVHKDVQLLKDYGQQVLNLPSPNFVKTYTNVRYPGAATCTIVRSAPNAPPNWSAQICARWGTTAVKNLNMEFVVEGSRLGVAELMDEIAKDITAARLYASHLAAMNASTNPALNAQFQGPKPSATLADLRMIDGKIADRLEKATDHTRTNQDLKAAITGGNAMEQALALCNALLNRFQFVIKGGFVRDVVVRGLSTFKDFDIELPMSVTQGNWQSEMATISNTLKKDFGVTCKPPLASNFNGPASMIRLETSAPLQVELECVAQWNQAYIPCKNMDFSVNNLRLEPKSSCVHQQVGFGMSVQQIVGQLRSSKPQASPLYDSSFQPGTGTNTGEGYTKTLWAVATGSMKNRLTWARGKGFWLVEASFNAATTGQTQYVLYHGTSPSAAQSIAQNGFKPSTSGNLGMGVYMSRDLTICKMFAAGGSKNVLSATVDVGRLFLAHGWDQTGNIWAAYDSVLLEQKYSPRQPPLEEWCIRDPKRIQNIKIYM